MQASATPQDQRAGASCAAPAEPRAGRLATQGLDETLRWIAQATAPLTGDDFFRTLMRNLAEAFGFRRAFIAECVDRPTTRVRTLAFWSDEQFRPNYEFDLAGTPCEMTIRDGQVYCVQDMLGEQYAWARRQRLDSYLGAPIFDASGRLLIGHVAFETSGTIDRSVLDNPVFQIFVSRAAAELRRRQAEEQAHRHLQQLAHVGRVSAMGQMASAIAHEINQPLTALRTYAQACQRLLAAGADPHELSDTLERVAQLSERASEIIRRLRAFLAREEVRAEPVDPQALVTEVLALVRADAAACGVRLAAELAPGLPPVQADRIQIEQVLLNLARNGIEAMQQLPDGAERQLAVSGRLEGQEVLLSVRDTGPGVAADAVPTLFDAFVTTKPGGMGIGLAISRSIAEAYRGRLWWDAEAGPGALFHLALPIAGAAR
jgi:signal transduction histidine kinase